MPPPRFISCQLCGQQFGSSSIGIHVPQCHEKMYKRWQGMDPKTRGPPPPMPVRASSGAGAGSGSQGGQRSSSTGVGSRGRGGGVSLGDISLPVKGGGGKPQPNFIHQTQYQFGQEYQPVSLSTCRRCGRGFSFDRLSYHESVCKGAGGGAPRKRFNSKKQRLGDFDAYELGAGGGKGAAARGGAGAAKALSPSSSSIKRTNWRKQHNEFISAIRDAKRFAPPRQSTPKAPARPGPRAPFQGSLQHNPVTTRHSYQQHYIASHAAMGNGGTRGRSSGPGGFRGGGGGGAGMGMSIGGGGGGGGFGSSSSNSSSMNQRAFGASSGSRFGGSAGGGGGGGWGGGGGGGGGGGMRIVNSNQTSLGMLQALGRV